MSEAPNSLQKKLGYFSQVYHIFYSSNTESFLNSARTQIKIQIYKFNLLYFSACISKAFNSLQKRFYDFHKYVIDFMRNTESIF